MATQLCTKHSELKRCWANYSNKSKFAQRQNKMQSHIYGVKEMMIYYIQSVDTDDAGPQHDTAFTTNKLAENYAAKMLNLHVGKFGYLCREDESRVARIRTMRLHVE